MVRRIVAVTVLVVLLTLVFQGARISALPIISVVLPFARVPVSRHRRRPRR